MRTITKSVLFGSPGGRSGMRAPALWVTLWVTLASAFAAALVALVVLALSPTAAQSAERHNDHNGKSIALSGKTWLKIDKDTAAALSDAGVKVEAVGAAVGPTAKRPYFTFPIDRKSTRLNSSHANISYAVFCLKKNKSVTPFLFLIAVSNSPQ